MSFVARGCALAFLAAGLGFGTPAAHAGAVYKYRMPDGRVLYSSEVSTSGELLQVMPEPPPPPQAIEAERLEKLKREREAVDKSVTKRLTTLDAVDAEIRAATEALKVALAAQSSGVEPLDGEHLGTRSGKSRLADPYWNRQRQLQRAVDDARRRLDQAYVARDAIR